jgi:hypothetical protein
MGGPPGKTKNHGIEDVGARIRMKPPRSYATQRFGMASFWNRCGDATALLG